ncbi:hypothetical protein [Streptomyces sp. NPDC001816]|uniref:hypothetical protein n=1 Tax=Streptomyces sp. NPDC001816 TaxID=3364612 RepID=UPI003696A0F4
MRAARAVWRRGMPAAVVAATAGAVGLAGASPATAAQTAVNCPTNDLQTAINNASSGDTLLVRGTCTGNFVIDRNLTLIGRRGAVLDGNQTGFTVRINSGVQAQLTTLTITNGRADNGGGIANLGGTLTVTRSTVRNNTATNNGGGINNEYPGTMTLNNSTVRNNAAGNPPAGSSATAP